MKNANKKVASIIKKIAETMADRAYGAASMWGLHQIAEPRKPQSLKK